ncbi:uncharacterized protein C9orf57 homolog [Pipistrellus kuhlii]|uniref:uncharacterized protein C9orf57 homolog n=1 Tax=Pipistrellus kuhlii TaxID=59472 RepID=UPI00174F2B1A|nr:uncharacterized protein C9orf57 homolog [Pipistrellus kuhlii]
MGIVIRPVFVLLCLLSALGLVESVLCRLCNLSIPFHGCLLDFGTCRTKPDQFCFKEIHFKGGIPWFSIKGCTETYTDCFKKRMIHHMLQISRCCHHPLCNF